MILQVVDGHAYSSLWIISNLFRWLPCQLFQDHISEAMILSCVRLTSQQYRLKAHEGISSMAWVQCLIGWQMMWARLPQAVLQINQLT